MKPTYRKWLEEQKYDPATINAQMYRAEGVEEHHGDLDQHYANDRMESLISTLRYAAEDKRRGRPNPSKIPFDGDIKSNLASYRNSVERYRRFRDSDDAGELAVTAGEPVPVDEDLGQKIGLERDIQAALRMQIEQLGPGLVIIDEGAERSVESGFIDITARDASGAIVVIELKAGSAGQRAVAQILSYMGDVAAEDEKVQVRGILVAADFDRKARAAARMVPNLLLRRYRVHFQFYDGGA